MRDKPLRRAGAGSPPAAAISISLVARFLFMWFSSACIDGVQASAVSSFSLRFDTIGELAFCVNRPTSFLRAAANSLMVGFSSLACVRRRLTPTSFLRLYLGRTKKHLLCHMSTAAFTTASWSCSCQSAQRVTMSCSLCLVILPRLLAPKIA